MQHVDPSGPSLESGQDDQSPIAFTRLPIFSVDRTIWGYSLAVTRRLAPVLAAREQAIENSYRILDLPGLALDRPVLLWATANMLDGTQDVPAHDGAVGLLIQPSQVEDEHLPERLRELSDRGVMTVLFDYQGTLAQNALLPLVTHVMIDCGNSGLVPTFLANHAQAAGARVIAEKDRKSVV